MEPIGGIRHYVASEVHSRVLERNNELDPIPRQVGDPRVGIGAKVVPSAHGAGTENFLYGLADSRNPQSVQTDVIDCGRSGQMLEVLMCVMDNEGCQSSIRV